MDDIAEQQDLANEISGAISSPMGFGNDVDEDDLLAELEGMEQEDMDRQVRGDIRGQFNRISRLKEGMEQEDMDRQVRGDIRGHFNRICRLKNRSGIILDGTLVYKSEDRSTGGLE